MRERAHKICLDLRKKHVSCFMFVLHLPEPNRIHGGRFHLSCWLLLSVWCHLYCVVCRPTDWISKHQNCGFRDKTRTVIIMRQQVLRLVTTNSCDKNFTATCIVFLFVFFQFVRSLCCCEVKSSSDWLPSPLDWFLQHVLCVFRRT